MKHGDQIRANTVGISFSSPREVEQVLMCARKTTHQDDAGCGSDLQADVAENGFLANAVCECNLVELNGRSEHALLVNGMDVLFWTLLTLDGLPQCPRIGPRSAGAPTENPSMHSCERQEV